MNKDNLADEQVAEEFWERIKTIKKLADVKKLTTLVDCFEYNNKIYCVLEAVSQLNLAKVMSTTYAEGCNEGFAQKTIKAVG